MDRIKDYEPLWGEWFIDDKLGEGSSGSVYRIRRKHQGNSFFAAVKIISIPHNEQEINHLRADGLDDEQIKNYYQDLLNQMVEEIDLQYSFRGVSNIVSIDDYQIIPKPDGISYDILIKMELLTDLHTYLRNNQLTKTEIIKLGVDLCRALELCHKQNVIHRDIKPENIFVSKHGDFKIGDFGVARKIEQTVVGLSHKGTYVYMAPEIYIGGEYNHTADLYSLGLVLYRILNLGKIPFLAGAKVLYRQKEIAIAKRMAGEVIPFPHSGNGILEQVIMKACSYQRKDRYQTAHAMREALEKLNLPPAQAQQLVPLFDNTITDLKVSDINAEDKDTVVSIIRGQGVEFGPKSSLVRPQLILKHKIKTWFKITILSILLFIFAIIGYNFMYPKVMVPSLLGFTETLAIQQLQTLGLPVTIDREYNYEFVVGRVVKQLPAPTSWLRKGQKVHITISLGKELMTIPVLEGITLEEATKIVANLGLKLKVTQSYHDEVLQGVIISQNLPAGDKLEKTGTIEVMVSRGMSVWSEWVAKLPNDVSEDKYFIDVKTQYSFRDKELTTSSVLLDDWTKYKETFVWSAWSPWSTVFVAATNNREVNTQQIADPLQYKTVHKYERWMYINTSDNWASSYAQYTGAYYKSSGRWERISLDTKLSTKGTVDGKTHYGSYCFGPSACSMSNYWWTYTTAQVALPQTYHTEYQYRDKQYTYYYYRWVAWSMWLDEVVKANSNRQVRSQKLYRFRFK
jgi:serine/threonine protein kinase